MGVGEYNGCFEGGGGGVQGMFWRVVGAYVMGESVGDMNFDVQKKNWRSLQENE